MTNSVGRLEELRALVKKTTRKHRSDKEKYEKVFTYLNRQRLTLGLTSGAVETLVVYDGHGKINAYGRFIDGATLFRGLNLSIGESGTRVTGRISYPTLINEPSHKKGHFICSTQLGIKESPFYLALVNISTIPEEAVPYPKTSLT